MTAQSYEHVVPASGQVLETPLSEIFGFGKCDEGPAAQLREDFRLIRESEIKADEAGAGIRLY